MSLKRLSILLLLFAPCILAQQWTLPFFTSDPRAVLAAANRYSFPEGLNAATLEYSVDVNIDAGKMTKTSRSITRVLRVQGIEGTRRLSVPWIVWRENRPKVKGRVITPDGRSIVLDDSMIVERGASDTNPDVKIITAEVPEMNLDSIVEWEVQQSDRAAGFPGGRFGEIVFNSAFLVEHFRVSLSSLGATPVVAEVRGFSSAPRQSLQSTGSAQQLTIEGSNVSSEPNLYLLPPEQTPHPTIAFTNVPSWQALASWYTGEIDKALGPASAHAAASGDQTSAIEDVLETARSKVHDNGAIWGASSYLPAMPATTLKKGAADGKDQAVLLISKLGELGITAKMALVSAGQGLDGLGPDVAPKLPGLEAFNRVLVYVPGTHPLWIDPTSELTPVSRLPLPDQGRWALIIDPAITTLVRTPEASKEENREVNAVELRLNDSAPASISETLEGSGVFADAIRPIVTQYNSKDADDKAEARSKLAHLSGAADVTKIEARDPKKLLGPFKLTITGEGYSGSKVGDEAGFVDIAGPVSANLQRLARLLRIRTDAGAPGMEEARKFDYYVQPPFVEESSYHIIPPSGFEFKQAPPVTALTIGPLELSGTSKLDADGSLWISYKLTNPTSRFTPQQVAAMRRDGQKLAGRAGIRLVFVNIGEERLAKGDIKDAVTLFRQRLKAAPTDVNAQLRLATAYLNAGAREAAAKVCTQLIAKNAENGAAYARLGWIYTHNEFGRPYAAGMNVAEAEKAYLKAIDLDGSTGYMIQLATLDTYNTAGIRFGTGTRFDDAVRWYRQAGLDALSAAGSINDYALTLLFAGRYEELRQFFNYPQADHAEQAIKIASIAAGSGARAVKEEADYLFRDPAKRKIVLIEAARLLLNARQYQAAVTLFEMAGGAGPAISQTGLTVLRRTSAFDGSSASRQPAIAAYQRFVAAAVNPAEPDAWKKVATPDLAAVPVERFRPFLFELLSGTPEFARQPSGWAFLSDLLTTGLEYEAQGDEQSGFHILAIDPAKKSVGRTAALVVKRGSDYVVAGVGSAPLEPRPPLEAGAMDPQHAQAHLLITEGKFVEAVGIETQICQNPKASASDWNELAWVALFAHSDEKAMQQAADKAAELSQGRNPDILHTLALVEASTGLVKEARANGQHLIDMGGDSDELLTLFGRIAEQLDLRDTATSYYSRVAKPKGDTALSQYAFAQMRLKSFTQPAPATP